MVRHCLLVSDFDQTLSFDDAGQLLAEMLEIADFEEKAAALSRLNMVQGGAELTYLLRHDPAFRVVRRKHLDEVGRRVRLKRNIPRVIELLREGIGGYTFDFYVLSAAPEEVVRSALDGIVEPDHIIGTRLGWDPETGEVTSVERVSAGYGKVQALEELRARLGVSGDRIVYVGDGSSDVHVMLHVNRSEGLTIAVSESRSIAQIAQRTVVADDALGILVPILEHLLGYDAAQVRAAFEARGLLIQDWEKSRTDWLSIREVPDDGAEAPGADG